MWDLGFDTIYAHQDREDDAFAGVKSTARLFGERTKPFLAASYVAALVLIVAAGAFAGLSPLFYPALIPAAGLLAWQVWTLDVHDPAHCLRLFRLNRETGLAVAGAVLVGWWG
jgi:4-hydroxybenzoate polyprenyltransferase